MRRNGITSTKGFTISELLLVFAIVFAVSAVMFPLIRYSHMRMDRTGCENNLQQIGLALYIYAREHNGKFPEDIKTLYIEEYLADKKVVDCPASNKTGTPEDPDYTYTAGLTVRDPSGTVILEDESDNHPSGGRNVLYVNGAIVWKR